MQRLALCLKPPAGGFVGPKAKVEALSEGGANTCLGICSHTFPELHIEVKVRETQMIV